MRRFLGQDGPVDGVAAEPIYLDVSVPPEERLPVEIYRNAFAYIFAGSAPSRCVDTFGVRVEKEVDGEELNIRDMSGNRGLRQWRRSDCAGGDQGIRVLLVSGKGPIEEPVAWHGPIVMNSREEIMQAMRELNGTFIKAAH
uniref:pirin-like C-terminal cupin domain-containing protein n=1 Tax=Rhizobium sp. F40D2 TaxID=3453141 RepID=UPI003F2030C5